VAAGGNHINLIFDILLGGECGNFGGLLTGFRCKALGGNGGYYVPGTNQFVPGQVSFPSSCEPSCSGKVYSGGTLTSGGNPGANRCRKSNTATAGSLGQGGKGDGSGGGGGGGGKK
jgi:hypothetical protein